MKPVVDAAAWTPEDLRDVESWSYRLTAGDGTELVRAAESVRENGISLEKINRTNFPLDTVGKILADVRRELLEGRGIVMLRGFPVERLDREGQAIAYLGLGAHLGERVSQNREGHILGHVKDLGGDY